MPRLAALSIRDAIWLRAWRVADGRWPPRGRAENGADQIEDARGELLELFHLAGGEGAEDWVQRSATRLQQRLMVRQEGTFEEIQRDAPFCRAVSQRLDLLWRGWRQGGEAGFLRAWKGAKPEAWPKRRKPQLPVHILGGSGDCERNAFWVEGAPDQETRVAAEWWYLRYTLGDEWEPLFHLTLTSGFSCHQIAEPPDRRRAIYFRLPWRDAAADQADSG